MSLLSGVTSLILVEKLLITEKRKRHKAKNPQQQTRQRSTEVDNLTEEFWKESHITASLVADGRGEEVLHCLQEYINKQEVCWQAVVSS